MNSGLASPKFMRLLATAVVLLLVAGATGLFLRRPREGTYPVTAYFDKAIGLFENSDVTVLGVAVGKVTTIAPEGRRVRVEMEIEDQYRVPADARAQIVPISVISDRYVQLFPAYTGGPRLAEGAVLDVDRTQIPAELDDVFAQLKKLLDAIEPGEEGEPGALGELIVQLDKALAGNEENLRGTISNAAELTQTLARADDDLSGILVNLDDFFATLSTRAHSITTLNANLATVLTALAESRGDLEGTVANLADLTNEVGDVVGAHRTRLTEDVRLALRIATTILDNERSFRQALRWLPRVAKGLRRAYQGGEINAVDIRDNLTAKLKCKVLDDLPDSPIKEELEKLCREETGEPEPKRAAGPVAPPEIDLDCEASVKKVRRQLRRLDRLDTTEREAEELVRRLKKKLRRLQAKCDDLEELLDDPESISDALEKLLEEIGGAPDGGALRNKDVEVPTLENLTGAAAPPGAVAAPESKEATGGVGSWLRSFLGFMGVSS